MHRAIDEKRRTNPFSEHTPSITTVKKKKMEREKDIIIMIVIIGILSIVLTRKLKLKNTLI